MNKFVFLFLMAVSALAQADRPNIVIGVGPGGIGVGIGGPQRPGVGYPPPPNYGNGYGQVCFYEHQNFNGRQICLNAGQRIDDLAQMGFNDAISSVRFLGGGMSVDVCRDSYFRNDCRRIDRDVYDFAQLGINDAISSVRVSGGYGGGNPGGGYPPPGGGYPGGGYPGGGYDPYQASGQVWSNPQSCNVGYQGACTVWMQFRMSHPSVAGILTIVDYTAPGGEKVVACEMGATQQGVYVNWITRGSHQFRLRAGRSCYDNIYNTRVVATTVVSGY